MGAGGVSKRLLNVCNVFFRKIHRWTCDSNYRVMYVLRKAVSGSGPATVAKQLVLW